MSACGGLSGTLNGPSESSAPVFTPSEPTTRNRACVLPGSSSRSAWKLLWVMSVASVRQVCPLSADSTSPSVVAMTTSPPAPAASELAVPCSGTAGCRGQLWPPSVDTYSTARAPPLHSRYRLLDW